MSASPKLLLSAHGKYSDGAVAAMVELCGRHGARLVEVNHQVFYDQLSLHLVLELPDGAAAAFGAEAGEVAGRLGLDADLRERLERLDSNQSRYYVLSLIGAELRVEALAELLGHLAQRGIRTLATKTLDHESLHVLELSVCHSGQIDRQRFMGDLIDFKTRHRLDLALQPDTPLRRNKRLIVFDADMTFIQCEVINELSRAAGREAEVEAITHRAMNGEMDFAEALRARVAMLEGLPLAAMEAVLRDIPFTPGVDRLVRILKRLGYKIAILSGGFDYFIKPIQDRFKLDYGYANTLEVAGGRLTGRVLGDIVDGARKEALLLEIAAKEGVSREQVIAVGDGANDLLMLSRAGLGIAFNAKRFLQERATGSLSQPSLEPLLYFLGLSRADFDYLCGEAEA